MHPVYVTRWLAVRLYWIGMITCEERAAQRKPAHAGRHPKLRAYTPRLRSP